jgi:predicted nucleotidyltransferase
MSDSAHELVAEMVRRIAERFHPDRIILFGSRARGDAGPDSDADLLVVMPIAGSRRSIATAIDMALWGIDLPADVLVVSPSELEFARTAESGVLGPALREGKVLYARSA